MCDKEAVERLQAALMQYTVRRKRFSEMSANEQTIEELCNALFMRLEHLKRCDADPKYDACEDKGKRLELGDLLHALGTLSDGGILEQVLSHENQDNLKSVLGSLQQVGQAQKSLLEEGLRKKDMAAFLAHSGDTDLLVDEQRKVSEAAARKDRR